LSVAGREGSSPRPPALSHAGSREHLFLVLGEPHRRTSPVRAAQPSWLTIPERGLYTGILVVGAIGSPTRRRPSWRGLVQLGGLVLIATSSRACCPSLSASSASGPAVRLLVLALLAYSLPASS